MTTNSSGWRQLIRSSEAEGVLVLDRIPSSPANSTLQNGDVIVGIDRKSTRTDDDVRSTIGSSTSRARVFTIRKPDGSQHQVPIELEPPPSLAAYEAFANGLASDPSPVRRLLYAEVGENREKAISVIDQLVTQVSNFPHAHAVRAVVHNQRRNRLPESSQAEKANEEAIIRTAISEAISQDPRSLEIRVAAAQIFVGLDEPGEAQANATLAVEIYPQSSEAHGELGKIYLLKGEAALALPHVKKAIRLDPYGPSYYSYLIEAFKQLGHTDRAAVLGKRLEEMINPPRDRSSLKRIVLLIGSILLLGIGANLAIDRARNGRKPKKLAA